jgi:Putative  PD-(D/E)XK family member, (DUF4420)
MTGNMRIEQLWASLESRRHQENAGSSNGALHWVLRRAQPTAECALLVGLELATGRRALLLEMEEMATPAKRLWPRCQGLEWVTTQVTHGVVYFGVLLKHTSQADLFDSLANDLARRVAAAERGPTSQLAALMGGVARWQKFLTAGTDGLGAEAQRGLYGELHFLREELIPNFSNDVALSAWKGHQAAHQDFLLSMGSVEVKTTIAKAPHIVHITSERQLDDRGLPALYLHHLALAIHDGAGETLPAMITSLRLLFVAAKETAEQFEDAILAAGYLDAHAWRYETKGYSIRVANDFWVRGPFPRLTERDLPDGIGDTHYALSLDACRTFLMPAGALVDALTGGSVQKSI